MFKLRNTTIVGDESWQNASVYTQTQILFENYLEIAALVPSILFMFINLVVSKRCDMEF